MCDPKTWFALGMGVVVGLMLIAILFAPLFLRAKTPPRKVKRRV